MASIKQRKIKRVLERLYDRYNRRDLIKPDPLQHVYRYRNKKDREVVALLSAVLAYGRVIQIEKSLTNLLSRFGDSPYEYILDFKAKQRKDFSGFRHRFTSGDDAVDLILVLQIILREYGSIKKLYMKDYDRTEQTIIPSLSRFCRELYEIYAGILKKDVTKGFRYLISDPANGSCCKRLNMFLRWMVRRDNVDPGLWKTVDPSKLIVPVDTHMARLCRLIGFHSQKSISLKTALQITERFAEICPKDPVKYDFCLSRIGIVENCTGKRKQQCDFCGIKEVCGR